MAGLTDLIKELLTERTRLLMTVIAIIWGTVSIGCMLAIGEGMRHNFVETLSAAGKNVIVLQGGQMRQSQKGVAVNQAVHLSVQDFLSIQKNLNDITVLAEYTFEAQLMTTSKETGVNVNAVAPIYGSMRNIVLQQGGRFINDIDMQNRRPVVVLGGQIANELFSGQEAVGKKIWINNAEFLVVGVTREKMQLWSYQDPDDYLAWIPESTFRSLSPDTLIKSILLVVDDFKQNAAVKQQITNIIALNHAVKGDLSGLIEWRDSQQLQEMTAKFFFGMQVFLGIIGALTLLVAGVGIGNVMLVSVRRRTREIGIRMALGARPHQVLWHHIAGALLATGIGGAIGLLMTVLIVQGLKQLHMPADYEQFLGQVHPELSISVVLIVIFVLGIIGFLAGYFPARIATKINPAEALRHE